MKTYNKTILVGNVAADPELHKTKNGNELSTFAIATNKRYKNSEGEQVEDVNYHRVVGWGKRSEVIQKHIAKGSLVMVEGQLNNNSYKNEKGEPRFRTEIVANDINILTWKKPKTDSSLATV